MSGDSPEKLPPASGPKPEAGRDDGLGGYKFSGSESSAGPGDTADVDDGVGGYEVTEMRYMSDLEHVRERSGMYIGNRDVRGLHHLVTEVVDNSVDEVMAGFAKVIQVTVNLDGSITVADDGRGIPVETDPSIGRSALEGVMTMLKYGG